jgi:HAD superfamily hydrolase (TIGR01509 family)
METAAVILDFDGLIVDTESPILGVWQEVFRGHGHELSLDDWERALGTHGGYDPCAHLAELTGLPFDHDELRSRVRTRNQVACEGLPLLPGVSALLQDARERGLRTAVASSSSRAWVEGWLSRHGIRPLIDEVCAREDVARVKPSPDLFLLAASRLGVPPRACLVFEDSPNGILAARRAGMRCVAVPNAVTARLTLPETDLVVSSLAEKTLAELLLCLGSARAE